MDWGAWLTHVAVNACRDRRRSGWWRWWRDRGVAIDDRTLPAAVRTPEDEVIGREEQRRVWEAVRRLPGRQREVFALRQLEGFSTDEVASMAAPDASAFGTRGGAPFHFVAGRGGPGGPGGHGGPPGMPLRLLLSQLTPTQRRQARELLIADRSERHATAEELRKAHDALADKMFAPGTLGEADIAPEVAKITTLHQQLLDHGTKVMLKVRAIATPEQLAKAAGTRRKLEALREEIDALGGPPSPDDDPHPE